MTGSGLRRAVALLTLAFGGLAPAADFGCPMADAAGAAAPTAPAAAPGEHVHAHHAPGTEQDVSSGDDTSVPESAPPCIRITGCGAAGLASPLRNRPALAAPARSALDLPTTDSYRTVFPTHEPPPPRLLV